MKKYTALLVAILLVVSALMMAGCQLTQPAAKEEQTGTPTDVDVDAAAVVARVGDAEITYGEFQSMFDSYASFYSSYGMDVASDPETLASFQEYVMDFLLEDKVVRYQATQQGYFDLSEEEQTKVDADAEAELASLMEYYNGLAEEAKAQDDTVDIEQYIADSILEEAKYYTGKEMTVDEYKQWIRDEAVASHCVELFKEAMLKDVTVSEDDIKTWYNDTLETTKTSYAQDAGAYKEAQEYFEMYGDDPVLYAPEGFSRVMDIEIAPEEQVSEDYTEKITQMDTLKQEYGQLAFDAAAEGTNNSTRMKEILDEYAALKTETDAMNAEYMASSRKSIDEAYAKLEAGTPFAEVMQEYTQNAEFTSYDAFKQNGKLISLEHDSETDWSDTIKDQFSKLKVGTYSPVFQDDDGLHILYYVADEPSGERQLADVHDQIHDLLLEDLKTTSWDELVAEWKTDKSVEIFEDVYKQTAVG